MSHLEHRDNTLLMLGYTLVDSVDLRPKVWWVEVQVCLIGGKRVIASGVKDTDDLRTLVVDDGVSFPGPQHGNTGSNRACHYHRASWLDDTCLAL